ncbi:hypothetical protein FRC17_006381, partial [Serendipita sp. 399]
MARSHRLIMQRGNGFVHGRQRSYAAPPREVASDIEDEGGYYHSLEDGEVEKGHYWDSIHRRDILRILEWEIISGHWMSWRPLSGWYGPPQNPSLPSPDSSDDADRPGGVKGCGWPRQYLLANELQLNQHNETKGNTLFPPRPVSGSIIDFDLVNERCDSTTGQYLRDCLEYLRIGAGLDITASYIRTGNTEGSPPVVRFREKPRNQKKGPLPLPQDWRYTYLEDRLAMHAPISSWRRYAGGKALEKPLNLPTPIPPTGGIPAYTIALGTKMIGVAEERSPEEVRKNFKWTAGQCEDRHPRIFHTYLDSTVTEGTYMTLLSFLYTQNLGLHLNLTEDDMKTRIPCRPEFWIWMKELDTDSSRWKETLWKTSWAVPLVDSRFTELIKFKSWNATEQMDASTEWSSEWRNAAVFVRQKKPNVDYEDESPFAGPAAGDHLHQSFNISMSDTARWLLPHRYGGVFLDPS